MEGFDEEEHPTTKLSVAFFVVVALHVVAVGGIYAFNSIKANRAPLPEQMAASSEKPAPVTSKTALPSKVAVAAPKPVAVPEKAKTAAPAPATAGNSTAKPFLTSEQQRAAFLATRGEPGAKKPAAKALPKTYTVEKGDTLMSIVRKLGVPYDDLVKANKIDDPKKLQIGHVLKVPQPKTTAAN